jgi:hypothetical protein
LTSASTTKCPRSSARSRTLLSKGET